MPQTHTHITVVTSLWSVLRSFSHLALVLCDIMPPSPICPSNISKSQLYVVFFLTSSFLLHGGTLHSWSHSCTQASPGLLLQWRTFKFSNWMLSESSQISLFCMYYCVMLMPRSALHYSSQDSPQPGNIADQDYTSHSLPCSRSADFWLLLSDQ